MKNKDLIQAQENLDIDEEKRYLREEKRPQQEQQSQLKETKKPKGYRAKKKSKI